MTQTVPVNDIEAIRARLMEAVGVSTEILAPIGETETDDSGDLNSREVFDLADEYDKSLLHTAANIAFDMGDSEVNEKRAIIYKNRGSLLVFAAKQAPALAMPTAEELSEVSLKDYMAERRAQAATLATQHNKGCRCNYCEVSKM